MPDENCPARTARYDGVAEWFDRELATSELGLSARQIAQRFLGAGPGRLLDVGCGGGSHAVAFAADGWSVTGIDISDDQLDLASVRIRASSGPTRASSRAKAVRSFTRATATSSGTRTVPA